ncbi:target of EGR1 protein 1-like protein [Leptotrombidium deliense]|uniref:Target of EGR1 protein 1-like protein n=1 Tax=Leptotrombidium deliense TaxID=299467 RepID=A0A443SPD4_9ACAR|nr:target of EGR1 protein 1-like protein [Leptotrombidium deliense]
MNTAQKMMSALENVSCQEISQKNVNQVWPQLLKSLRECHFAALDFEFSGIGSKSVFQLPNVEDRYKAIAEAAKSRAILSFGISLFKLTKKKKESVDGPETNNALTYDVHNYNIFTSCFDEYEQEEDAINFLISHGFDFDRQISEGMPYYKGNDMEEDIDANSNSVRSFFAEILKREIPIVVHNGFIDLVFMYQSFYCQLPATLQTFLCNLREMFPVGVYDTKYIAEYQDRMDSSFLEYVFHEKQIRNLEKKVACKPHIELIFSLPDDGGSYFLTRNLKTVIGAEKPEGVIVCKNYTSHGWCRKGTSCPQSHDIHLILSEKTKSKGMKKKMNALKQMVGSNAENSENKVAVNQSSNETKAIETQNGKKEDEIEEKKPEVNPMNVKNGLHSSGFDAFMTGYCFAVNHAIHGETNIDSTCVYRASKLKFKNLVFNLYLTGKDQPLRVAKSAYAEPSKNHTQKMARIKNKANITC